MIERGFKLFVAGLLGVASLMGLVGTAAAYFTSTGSGTATSSTGDLLPLTAGTATPDGALYPGGTAAVVLQVSNPNAEAVTVATITAAGAVSVVGDAATCAPSYVTFTGPTPETVAAIGTVAGNGTKTITLPAAASMSSTAPAGCQSRTFTIPVTVGVKR